MALTLTLTLETYDAWTAAQKEGADAHEERNADQSSYPYAPGTIEYDEWVQGWECLEAL
jgi:hypothetical protein